ncbi:hypothetical protein HK103_004960 [Boothiomyces macroporosus]|uniref:BTB domain-containing protein n=1 Tax=Boothiomyces macroporosus TaxID=261099 RepID=A0AAD5UG51_9FUNG|nr:hypothetical protein HK103_004960 [Boothiomyces macroporosus]
MTTQNGYHEVICSHLYQNGYLKGMYADLIVRMQYQPLGQDTKKTAVDGIMFKLHRIIAIRSPFLQGLLQDQELNSEYQPTSQLTIVTHDKNLTPAGLGVAFGHLYASYSQHLLAQDMPLDERQNETRSTLLCSVLSAANLLQLHDLAQLTTEYIKQSMSRDTVIQYCGFLQESGHQQQELKDAVFTYLCRGVVLETLENVGLIWGCEDGKGFAALVKLFVELPFEWLKNVIESKYFEVPSDMERFSFAKAVIEQRKAVNGVAPVEENVLLTFGGKRQSGVTVVRKSKSVSQIALIPNGTNGERRIWKAGQV